MNLRILSLAIILIGAFAVSSKAQQNLVSNGGFETDNFDGWTTQNAPDGSDFGVTTTMPYEGTYSAEFGGVSNQFDYISQALDTVIGTTYYVSFELANDQTDNEFLANIGGVLQDTPAGVSAGGVDNYIKGGTTYLDLVNTPTVPYSQYQTSFTATSSTTNLIFGGYNVPSFYYLDDVVVVPEPSQYGLLVFLAVVGFIGWRRFSCSSLTI